MAVTEWGGANSKILVMPVGAARSLDQTALSHNRIKIIGYVIGEVWCVSSTLCMYDIRMGLLLVRSWARVRRVSLGRESLEGEILGACRCISLLWLRCRRCVCTMLVCICVEFAEICCCVAVSGCVSMLVV